MTDTEYRIIATLHRLCTAQSRMLSVLSTSHDGKDIDWINRELSAAAEVGQPLMDALEARLRQGPLSPPSSDDKSPTAATGEANSGTPEAPPNALRYYWDAGEKEFTRSNEDRQ